MSMLPGLEQAQSFISCHVRPAGRPTPPRRLAVTFSRQAGSGAWLVARELAGVLDKRAPAEGVKWTVFDKELVEKILEDHNLSKRLAEFMPEDRVSMLDDMITEVLGLHPPSWTLARSASDTILKLAELGNVILIGRGSVLITAKLPHVLHVRLVGSIEHRIRRVMEQLKLERKAAIEFIERADRGHARYVREHFKAEIENPLLYDLVLNTDRVDIPFAAQLIADTLLRVAGTPREAKPTNATA